MTHGNHIKSMAFQGAYQAWEKGVYNHRMFIDGQDVQVDIFAR